MPFLALVHLRELRCPECGEMLAQPGARSFVVGAEGEAVVFAAGDPAAEMTVELTCPNGHAVELLVPNEISAEHTLDTPDDAPVAADALLRAGITESGQAL